MCARRESNPHFTHYEGVTLSIELRAHREPTAQTVGVPVMGLEPTRRGIGSSLASEASVYYQFHHTGIVRGSEGLRFPRPRHPQSFLLYGHCSTSSSSNSSSS